MMDILTATDWVISTLKADSELGELVSDRVYLDVVPPQITPVYPYVVVSYVDGEPVGNASADYFMSDDLVDVDVYDKSSSAVQAAQVFNRARDVLHKASGGATAGGTVIGCIYLGPNPLPPEVEDRTLYQRKSGSFRVYTQ